jgi:phage shock protein PspC (stress-responsive transcriptional regulator)
MADETTPPPGDPKPADPAPDCCDHGTRSREDLMRPPPPPRAPLRRYPDAGWLGGVCAGIAYQLDVPTWLVRFVWTLFFLTFGTGLIVYLLFWIFVPKMDTPLDHDTRF